MACLQKWEIVTVHLRVVSGTFYPRLNIIRPSYSESMQGILSQPQPSRRNEYGHSGVQYDAFSMMYSSCLPLLNLRRKGLKPNTSVKSMNHPLFISFNWKKRGRRENCSPQMGCVVPFFFLLRPDEKKKKKQRSLSLSTHLSLWLWENRIGGET